MVGIAHPIRSSCIYNLIFLCNWRCKVIEIASTSHGYLVLPSFSTFLHPSSHESHGLQGNLIFCYLHIQSFNQRVTWFSVIFHLQKFNQLTTCTGPVIYSDIWYIALIPYASGIKSGSRPRSMGVMSRDPNAPPPPIRVGPGPLIQIFNLMGMGTGSLT